MERWEEEEERDVSAGSRGSIRWASRGGWFEMELLRLPAPEVTVLELVRS